MEPRKDERICRDVEGRFQGSRPPHSSIEQGMQLPTAANCAFLDRNENARPIFRRKSGHESQFQCDVRLVHGQHPNFPTMTGGEEYMTPQPRYIPTIPSSESLGPAQHGHPYIYKQNSPYSYRYRSSQTLRPTTTIETRNLTSIPPGATRDTSFSNTPNHPNSYPYYHWAPIPSVEYISDIKPDDVLSGRGGATNSHSGNRAFRSLVKRYQDQYLKAKKRDKPAVASIIVEKVREKGGRFLKRIDTTPDGRVLWIDIGDDRAKEKTCQALREGAPEIRRKRKATSTDEEDAKKSSDDAENLSPSSSFGRSTSNDDGSGADSKRTLIVRSTTESDAWDQAFREQSAPIMIRPSSVLIRKRVPVEIAVDQLNSHERELYLRDFLPPDPGIRHSKSAAV